MSALHLVRSQSAAISAALVAFAVVAAPAAAAGPAEMSAARDYCSSVGGEVQQRQAMWNTNADVSSWVDLGRSLEVCRFTADDEAGSRIYVDLLTLWSESPSLAAAAYLAKIPMSDESPPGNPATFYCSELSGSSQFGIGAAGGGWVDPDDPDDPVVALCVFPDGSAIDDWGIAYHSGGTVRGADLAGLFRTDISQMPPIFG
jgi:putative hemolysin